MLPYAIYCSAKSITEKYHNSNLNQAHFPQVQNASHYSTWRDKKWSVPLMPALRTRQLQERFLYSQENQVLQFLQKCHIWTYFKEEIMTFDLIFFSSHKIYGFRVSLRSHFTLTFIILLSLKENVSRNKLKVEPRSWTEMGEEQQADQHSSLFP